MSNALTMNEKNYSELTKGVCLIDFWAPWCGPCRLLSPTIEALSGEYSTKANICKVNVDDEVGLAQKFGVRSIPMIVILKDGKIVHSTTGNKSIDHLKKALEDAITLPKA